MRRALLIGCLVLASCTWLKTFVSESRDTLLPAGAAAVCYILTEAAAPPVALLTIFAGTAGTIALTRAASYASGETQGEGAVDKEFARLKERVPILERNLVATQGALSWFAIWFARLKWAGLVAAGYMGIKYLHPRSRAARNFWGGVVGVVRGESGSLKRMVSATGLAHTPVKPNDPASS